MDLGLTGKVALVAAASKGLGRAIAEEFAREGAKVAMCSREESAITAAAEDIRRKTGNKNILPIAADLSTSEGCETFVQNAIGAFHTIDILIVNAGGPPPGRFDDLDDAAWQKAVDLTLFSAVRLTRLALPQMRKQKGGSIVYSTSTSVRQPTQYLNLILSNAVRAAVHGMLKTLSADLAKDGIRVNAVQPGRIATDRLVQPDTHTPESQNNTPGGVLESDVETVIPLGRYGEPAEDAPAGGFIPSS